MRGLDQLLRAIDELMRSEPDELMGGSASDRDIVREKILAVHLAAKEVVMDSPRSIGSLRAIGFSVRSDIPDRAVVTQSYLRVECDPFDADTSGDHAAVRLGFANGQARWKK